MSSRRTLILVAAIGIGVVAALLVFNYVQGIKSDEDDAQRKVSVLQVKKQITKGTSGATALDSQMIDTAEIPNKYYPPSGIEDPQAIVDKVALFDIPPNAIVIDGMFVDVDVASDSLANRLHQDLATVTISVDEVAGVGHLLVPEDEVNVMVITQKEPPEDVQPGSKNLDDVMADVRYVYQQVRVLAVGRTTEVVGVQATAGDGAAGQAAAPVEEENQGLITFAVTPEAVPLILSASKSDGVTLVLSLTGTGYEPRALPKIEDFENLPGETAGGTPYGGGRSYDEFLEAAAEAEESAAEG